MTISTQPKFGTIYKLNYMNANKKAPPLSAKQQTAVRNAARDQTNTLLNDTMNRDFFQDRTTMSRDRIAPNATPQPDDYLIDGIHHHYLQGALQALKETLVFQNDGKKLITDPSKLSADSQPLYAAHYALEQELIKGSNDGGHTKTLNVKFKLDKKGEVDKASLNLEGFNIESGIMPSASDKELQRKLESIGKR